MRSNSPFSTGLTGRSDLLTSAFAQAAAAPETAVDAGGRQRSPREGGRRCDRLSEDLEAPRLVQRPGRSAVTALVTTAILRNGRSVDDPQVANRSNTSKASSSPTAEFASRKAIIRITKHVWRLSASPQPTGWRYAKLLTQCREVRQRRAVGRRRGHDRSNPNYGCAGYGGKKTPRPLEHQLLARLL